jgi:hypothetical protein
MHRSRTDGPPLVSGSWTSPRPLGGGFLRTPLGDGALALLLAFGSADPWRGAFHPISSGSCLAHTPGWSRGREAVGSKPLLDQLLLQLG